MTDIRQSKELAPDWLGIGKCLITGGVSNLYIKNKSLTNEKRQSKRKKHLNK